MALFAARTSQHVFFIIITFSPPPFVQCIGMCSMTRRGRWCCLPASDGDMDPEDHDHALLPLRTGVPSHQTLQSDQRKNKELHTQFILLRWVYYVNNLVNDDIVNNIDIMVKYSQGAVSRGVEGTYTYPPRHWQEQNKYVGFGTPWQVLYWA